MLGKGQKPSKNANDKNLTNETKVLYNKESGETVSMNDNINTCENGVEATNLYAQAACSATMDEFRREGIVMLSKMEENGSLVEVLCPGTLVVRSATLGAGPMLKWVPDDPTFTEATQSFSQFTKHSTQPFDTMSNNDRCSVGATKFGSLNDREWTVVSDGVGNDTSNRSVMLTLNNTSENKHPVPSGKMIVRPIHVELSEIKSFQLCDDGNQLVLIQKDGTSNNPLIFLDEGPEQLIEVLKRYMCVRQSASDENLYLLTDARIEALDKSLSQLQLFDRTNTDAVWKFVSDIQRDPYATAMTAFSKITDKLIFSPDEDSRPEEDLSDLLAKSFHQVRNGGSSLDVTSTGDGEFEVVTPRRRLLEDLPKVNRAEAMCQLDWELHFESDGRVVDLEELKEKIFRGGVEHEIRCDVWKYLLGFYDWNSSSEERTRVRSEKVSDYHRMKEQWRSITMDQEDRFSAFRERKTQIEKDVSRTDRSHPFFAGDGNKYIDLLQDILMTYIMYDFDLGYVQGMSDLLSPILFVMENEVDAFWCFVGFMKHVKQNFDFDQGGIKTQLSELIDLLKTLDPDFYAYLDAKDSGNLYFCFRWLLIWFKREFAFTDVMRLWEVMWTGLPCKNFHLLVCLALIESEKPSIVENQFGFSEILKHVNDLSYRIHLNTVLIKAEAIWQKIKKEGDNKQTSGLSNAARRVLGMEEITAQDIILDGSGDIANSIKENDERENEVEVMGENTKCAKKNGCEMKASKPMAIINAERRCSRNSHSYNVRQGLTGHALQNGKILHDQLAVKKSRLSSNNESSSDPNSLNDSSSVEVLSELDDEARFENGLSSFNHFES